MLPQAIIVVPLIVIEFINAVAMSVIPTLDLLGIVLDPIALGSVSQIHAKVSQNNFF
jgi:hypothetical protein